MRIKIFFVLIISFVLLSGFYKNELCWWCAANNCSLCLSDEPPSFADVDDETSGGGGNESWPKVCDIGPRTLDWSFDTGQFVTSGMWFLYKGCGGCWPVSTVNHTVDQFAILPGGDITLGVFHIYEGLGTVFADFKVKIVPTIGGNTAGTIFLSKFTFTRFPGDCY